VYNDVKEIYWNFTAWKSNRWF